MSKHKSYNEYYKPKKEETVENVSEEVQNTEETVEASPEEKEETTEPVEEVKEETPEYFEVVGAGRVNLRLTPSKESKVIAVLSKGEKVEHINNPAPMGWKRVKYKEFEGFMMSQFLKEIK